MANTVNDVMNVIASPDYGIKNIAGTNQEILAVLLGVHNSKNNIHNIIDDVKSLLQKLVQTTKKKPVEVDSKSIKLKQKHVKDILDETKGIKKSIDNLSKALAKQGGTNMPAVAKLTDKASQKVADAMVKSMEKQNKGGGMSAIVDAFTKLKNISLKDILLGKRKVKIISNIFKNAKKDLNIEDKELDNVIKLINASPEMMKSLSKVNKKINRIIKNDTIKKLKDILIGKNSILSISNILQKNKEIFDDANKSAKSLEGLVISLNKAIRKLFFASLWSKVASNGVSSITNMVQKIIPLCKKLVKSKSDIEKGVEVAKNLSTLTGKLLVSSIYLTLGIIFVGPAIIGAKLLTFVINNVTSIAKKLVKSNKDIEKGKKAAKGLAVITGSLLLTSILLSLGIKASLIGMLGAVLMSAMVEVILPITKKLAKYNKDIEKGKKAAIGLVVITGSLLLTSIFLSMSFKHSLLGILGAVLISAIVEIILPITKKLSKNSKHIGKAIISSIGLVVVTGLMYLTTAILANIGLKMGVSALLGSVLLYGIIWINVKIYKMLGKALKNIVIGSISMAIMSLSLILFSVALNKIVNATKDVSFKQVGVIALLTVVLGGAVALLGIPALFPFILLGSISIAIMGFALRPFAKTLAILASATKKLKFGDILLVAGSMLTLATTISGLALFLIPVLLGNITLKAINKTFGSFVRTLKIIHDMENIPQKKVREVLNAMSTIKSFFKGAFGLFGTWKIVRNARIYASLMAPFATAVRALSVLSKMPDIPIRKVWQAIGAMSGIRGFFTWSKVTWKTLFNSYRYSNMMIPFVSAVRNLSKLRKLGSVPMRFVHQTLNAMRTIANYFANNKIKWKTIRQAYRYGIMLRPFKSVIRSLNRLKKLGSIPMRFVHQTLNAMRTIADYFTNNKIKWKTIRQAYRYGIMLGPFKSIVRSFAKIKKLGSIPMRFVHQTLNAMRTIADYYTNNKIKWKTIRQAYRYGAMLRPFGNTVFYLGRLKKMGSIPMRLVRGALNAIAEIAAFYQNQDMGFWGGWKARISAAMITGIVVSFGRAVRALKTLKELRRVPMDAVRDTIMALWDITFFYRFVTFGDNIEEKSKLTKEVVGKFNDMAIDVQKKLARIKGVDFNAINSIVLACRAIIRYYRRTKFFVRKRKVLNMNECVMLFLTTARAVERNTKNFTDSNFKSVILSIVAMKEMLSFLKFYSMSRSQRRRAKRNLRMLNLMALTMKGLSTVNTSNISSVGDALSNALGGVNSVDLSQVTAVTEMFNAFNNINKSENIINKFTESVNKFTEACKNLMDAMGNNTNAINNIDLNGGETSTDNSSQTTNSGTTINKSSSNNGNNKGVRIANVDELAETIAKKINGALSVDMPDTQIQLLINGQGGNEWTITKY